jgi:flagellar assembly protein FliH
MPRPVKLELFETERPADGSGDTVVLTAQALEEARLAAYEEGYKAGWDDAVAAAEADGQSQQREVARHLQELSFGYHEVRAHLRDGLVPLLEAICSRVVPELARAALGGLAREALMPMADAALDRPVRMLVHPDARRTLEAALYGLVAPPFEIVEEPSLSPGQVHLRAGVEERRIDVDAASEAIAGAVAEFFATHDQPETEEALRSHG